MFRRMFLKILALLPLGIFVRPTKGSPDDEQWFVNDGDGGFETFNTEAEAIAFARKCIDYCLDDTWDESVERIFVGKIVHRTRQENVVTREMLDSEGCYDDRHYHGKHVDYWCEYNIG